MRVVIASRQSDLAKIQAYQVGEALQKKHSEIKIEYHFRESLGDINSQDPLWKMPEKGVFTEDFYQGLCQGRWDLVVHSWKDLPVEDKVGTEIAATLPREDVRDLLLMKKGRRGKAEIKLLSSSPRRAYNLTQHLPDLLPAGLQKLSFEAVRGNVQTRVRKLLEGDADGLIVAKAALDRLLSASREEFQITKDFLRRSLQQLDWMVLPVSLNPTAAAQGALAIEIAKDRKDLKEILKAIHHESTFATVQKERRQLQSWGGGCHQKIGINVLPREYGEIWLAKGQRDNGELIDQLELKSEQKISSGKYFPTGTAPAWFEREFFKPEVDLSKVNAHWVSKEEALPPNQSIADTDILWTAGVRTWKRLALRGLWVNGSAESFGEKEDERIEHLAATDLRWCKWTHEQGMAEPKAFLVAKTYQLVPKKEIPLLEEQTQHFCWMSGSSFLLALEHYPWLKDKDHWSGPGHTYEQIDQELKKRGGQGVARVALSLEQWQKKMNSK